MYIACHTFMCMMFKLPCGSCYMECIPPRRNPSHLQLIVCSTLHYILSAMRHVSHGTWCMTLGASCMADGYTGVICNRQNTQRMLHFDVGVRAFLVASVTSNDTQNTFVGHRQWHDVYHMLYTVCISMYGSLWRRRRCIDRTHANAYVYARAHPYNYAYKHVVLEPRGHAGQISTLHATLRR